ncbi:MAG: hypothetical protein KatS3mg043_2022 [Rhodothermaceae bacterium]|nr:MAG: hypothetical protein KatS3mg043_2022 [Rhodothermaceae bacterium]
MRSLLLLLLFVPAAGPPPGFEPGFRFVRIRYQTVPYARAATWAYDYPTAELNLYEAIRRTTRITLEGPPLVLTLDDPRIFDYPVLYLCEPGYWQTNDAEVENLRKYFARGGFMIIDDFHDWPGRPRHEWNNFYRNIKQVFPDREPVELASDHPIWRIYFDIDPVEAASTKPGFHRYQDRYYALFDDDGRMLCVICYNQDIGDGWEWPDRNQEDASTVSFQMAINFIMYALTH